MRTILITGATGGIGSALSTRFAKAGDRIALHYHRREQEAQSLVDELKAQGVEVCSFASDLTEEGASTQLVKEVIQEFGQIDVLVSNAGRLRDQYAITIGEKSWRETMALNLDAAFFCAKAAMRDMMKRKQGSVVFVGSVAGLIGDVARVHYCGSKAGLHGITVALSREMAASGIRVNAIAPGYVDTSMTENLKDERKENALSRIPLGRFAHPDEIAGTVFYLCSKEASYITGQILRVDGGLN